jgi:hypothetical protein
MLSLPESLMIPCSHFLWARYSHALYIRDAAHVAHTQDSCMFFIFFIVVESAILQRACRSIRALFAVCLFQGIQRRKQQTHSQTHTHTQRDAHAFFFHAGVCRGCCASTHTQAKKCTYIYLCAHPVSVQEVQLHKESPLGDAILECYASGTRNVFVLGFVPVKSGKCMWRLCVPQFCF